MMDWLRKNSGDVIDWLTKLLPDGNAVEDKVVPPKKRAVPKEQKVVVRFNLGNVAKVIILVLLAMVLTGVALKIQNILLMLFLAFLLASAMGPTVDWLQRKKFPRGISVILIYLVAIGAILGFLSSFLPILGTELINLGKSLQKLVADFVAGDVNVPALDFVLQPLRDFISAQDLSDVVANVEENLQEYGRQLTQFAGNAFKVLAEFSNGLFNFLVVLVLSFLLVVDQESVNRFIVRLFPARYEEYILEKNRAIQRKTGYWIQGQVMLMVIIAVVTYVGLLILGVEYALTLAVLTGILELLPAIGPIVALLVTLPIVANQALWLLIAVPILFFVIQQLENNVIVPLVMKKAVGLSPIVVILAALIGAKLLGVLGLIISVPVATMIGLFLDDYLSAKR